MAVNKSTEILPISYILNLGFGSGFESGLTSTGKWQVGSGQIGIKTMLIQWISKGLSNLEQVYGSRAF
jgi:hypothetical protein